MRRRLSPGYLYFRAGTHPTEERRGERMYQDFDIGLARERTAQMRTEVARNRLDARLAREARFAKASALSEEARLAKARLGDEAVLGGGMVDRGFARVLALFGAHSAP